MSHKKKTPKKVYELIINKNDQILKENESETWFRKNGQKFWKNCFFTFKQMNTPKFAEHHRGLFFFFLLNFVEKMNIRLKMENKI
jgi:hypothetical protein